MTKISYRRHHFPPEIIQSLLYVCLHDFDLTSGLAQDGGEHPPTQFPELGVSSERTNGEPYTRYLTAPQSHPPK